MVLLIHFTGWIGESSSFQLFVWPHEVAEDSFTIPYNNTYMWGGWIIERAKREHSLVMTFHIYIYICVYVFRYVNGGAI